MGSLEKSRLDHYKQDRLSERFSGSTTPTTARPWQCEPQDSSILFSPAVRNYHFDTGYLK